MNDTESSKEPKKKKWTEIAEVRMLMYVIPVGVALALLGLVLSQLSGH